MTDVMPSTQLKMPLPQSHNYERHDIQMQVIIKENESRLCRTKLKTSSESVEKPVTRAQDFVNNDNITNVQDRKLYLNQSRDFRTNENTCGRLANGMHHPPTGFLASKKPRSKMKCLDTTYINEIISQKHYERVWDYLKWPLLAFLLCAFIGFLTYACVNSLNDKNMVLKCLNSSTNANCLIASKMKRNQSVSLHLSSRSETNILDDKKEEQEVEEEEVTEAVLKASTTLLRPIILSLQTNFRDNESKNDYTTIERKQQKYKEDEVTRKESSYGPEHSSKDVKDKTDTLNLLGFTSGHQNNFGIPIEEDERVLRLLNEEIFKLQQQTESSNVDERTEGSVKVSPTVPLILHDLVDTSTLSTGQSEDIQCQSTSLNMCRGVLQYDLTSSTPKSLNLDSSEIKMFEQLFASNCSARAAEFVCSAFEPECRPTQIGSLQPCKRICKSILEACSSLIVSSDILTYTFDCDKYPDSDDKNVCEDPTRRKDCYENEFKCGDSSCIPNQWQCDNIKDCSEGDDELGCLICNPEEFRCRSNEKCLEDKFRCDLNEDCVDGSDEHDCFSDENNEDPQQYPRIFSFASFLPLNNTANENSFTVISEDRLALGSELNESLMLGSRNLSIITAEMLKGQFLNDFSNISRSLANFQDSKEIMMTSDSENKLKVSKSANATEKGSIQSEATTACVGDQLRCVSGKCITVDQLCDKVVDCPEGEDELMCTYDERPKPKKS